MKLNDVKISHKIIGGFTILLIITAIIGFVGYNSLINAGERVEKFEGAVNIEKLGNALRAEAKNFVIAGDDYYGGREETVLFYYDQKAEELSGVITETKAMFERQVDIDAIEELNGAFEDYDKAMQNYFEKSDEQQVAINEMDTVAVTLMNVVNNLVNDQGDKLEQEILQDLSPGQLENRDQLLKESNLILDHVNAMRIHAKNILLGHLDEAEIWKAELAEAKKWTETVKAKFDDQFNINQANEILDALDEYGDAGEDYIQSEHDLATALGEASVAGEHFDELTFELKESQNKAMETEEARAITMLIIFAVLAVIIGIFIALFITRAITKPVNKIAKEAKELAETGDLSKRATVMGKDEIGVMAESINNMLDNTARPVERLSEIAETIAQGDLRVKIDVEAKGDIVT
ncbi:MAG: HAMP domain-containing protein, partial [Minisyncoccales bacterium]